MATFSSSTTDDINSVKTIRGSSTGWAAAVGGAIDGVADELGTAALENKTAETGDLIKGDDDGRLRTQELPATIPVGHLPTGILNGQLPLIGTNGLLPTSIIPDTAGVFDIASANVARSTFTGNAKWPKPSNLRFVYLRMCGAGGRAGANNNDTTIAIGHRSYPRTFILPAHLIPDSADVVVGQLTDRLEGARLPTRGGDSSFAGIARVRGGLQLEHGISTPTELRDSRAASRAVLNEYYDSPATAGLTGVAGLTDPTNSATYREGTRSTYSVNFVGWGSPNSPGVVEVWAITEGA